MLAVITMGRKWFPHDQLTPIARQQLMDDVIVMLHIYWEVILKRGPIPQDTLLQKFYKYVTLQSKGFKLMWPMPKKNARFINFNIPDGSVVLRLAFESGLSTTCFYFFMVLMVYRIVSETPLQFYDIACNFYSRIDPRYAYVGL